MPRPSSNQPGRRAGMCPYGAPIRSCTRWGLPCRPCCQGRGALLPHPFALTRPKPGGMLSVALSLTPDQARGRRALPGTVIPWSPDFPRPARREPRPPSPLATCDIVVSSEPYESRVPIRFGWQVIILYVPDTWKRPPKRVANQKLKVSRSYPNRGWRRVSKPARQHVASDRPWFRFRAHKNRSRCASHPRHHDQD